jgi:hypothetical protein
VVQKSAIDASEWTAIKHVVNRLQEIYPSVPVDTVATVVHHNHARFDGRPIRDYVPLFVERGSRRELANLSG